MDIKKALENALWDTLDVALWVGIPATGVSGLLLILGEQYPVVVTLSPYIAGLINIIVYFLKRLVYYKKGGLSREEQVKALEEAAK